MSSSFYGTNTRGHLFYEFLDMSTPIESIINNDSQRFSVSNLLDLSTVDRKCRGTVRLLCLCLDPMRMNSVLVIVRVNLFALNQL